MRKKRRIQIEVGSGNIFADLGLPDAEEHLLKASLVVQLHRLYAKNEKSDLTAQDKRKFAALLKEITAQW